MLQQSPMLYEFFNSVIYIFLGILLFVLCIYLAEKCFKWSLHKELIEDQNIALGIMFAGFFISLAIIIAAAIQG